MVITSVSMPLQFIMKIMRANILVTKDLSPPLSLSLISSPPILHPQVVGRYQQQ